jgi:hypothetical protein
MADISKIITMAIIKGLVNGIIAVISKIITMTTIKGFVNGIIK